MITLMLLLIKKQEIHSVYYHTLGESCVLIAYGLNAKIILKLMLNYKLPWGFFACKDASE